MLIDNPFAELTIHTAHIWLVDLTDFWSEVNFFRQFLSPDEVVRGDRFKFVTDQVNFICTRGIARWILAKYLGSTPTDLQFSYTEKGKPFLADALNHLNLNFNISHSKNLAVYAITQANLIGVDIEYLRTNLDVLALAKRFFSPQEYLAISNLSNNLSSNLSENTQLNLFFRLWTCKEAYLKAVGLGIAGGLDRVVVSLGNSVEERSPVLSYVEDSNNYQVLDNWLLQELDIKSQVTVPAEYFGAIALNSRQVNLQYFNFQQYFHLLND
jgi:4'-phosphopantetheinyl transferase